ncbi:MAG TPA: DUF167 family protein [Methanospirillum sp.]|nr:DUF167 family protein [Methanospirillum sp.]
MVTPEQIRPALVSCDDGVILTVEVTAGSRKERFPAGYNTWRHAVGIQVKAPALEGKANKAITHLIADTIGISRAGVSITTGQTSTIKRINISGVSLHDIIAFLTDRIDS